jgi:hypothetical protein
MLPDDLVGTIALVADYREWQTEGRAPILILATYAQRRDAR